MLNLKVLNPAILLLFSFLIISCSAKQVELQSQLEVLEEEKFSYFLEDIVEIKAAKAKTTILKNGTRWTKVGLINQGVVFRTKDQIVIVNSFNVHEGYIVVDQGNVVGYYLPVEKTFVESNHTPIKLTKLEHTNEI